MSGSNATWIPVNWRCTACDSSTASVSGGNTDSRSIEASCPGNADRINASLVIVEESSSAQSATNDVVADNVSSTSFDGIEYPVSLGNDTSESSNVVIKEPDVSKSGGGSSGIGAGSSSSVSDNATGSINNGGSDFWSSSGSTSMKPWNEQGEKSASPVPYNPSVLTPPPPMVSSSDNGVSPSPAFVPASTNSPAVGPGSESTDLSPTSTLPVPATEPANSGTADIDFPAATPAAPVKNSTGSDYSRTSSSGSSSSTSDPVTVNKSLPPATTAAPPSQTSGSSDQSSGDGSLSATSTVTKSPFFYASIVLAVAGFIGVVVGYRAKRKRRHRNEERNYRVSTPASIPSSPTNLAGRVQFDDHNIVVL
ncbi:hypothetical protein PR003_g731 [Phytophthora rubi]|uniref:Uncharacterized protein n=1 Tax=Phytophthora rubi TaxID=129364 RepID=A0A6A3NZC8_9STRA|nr:hypothetical protein PR002_g619 [Phytophthora rubi]KAE9051374.1 hypothetical protein PR001_g1521 [Phytophthora rubi]KAE9359432.1 hypothetical protein PR003_g731 [Phytophthora rubi]